MSGSKAPIVGRAGVKYGLQLPGKPQAKPALPNKKLNVFGDDSDDEEDVSLQLARQAARKQSDAKVQEMQQKALEEDPTVFDYDGVYDSMVEAKKNPRLTEKVQRESKYIGLLLQQKVVRDKEQDIAYERRVLKERKKEDHMFEDKEKFVTAAYRKKLEEDKKWQEQQRLKDEQDEKNQAHKVGHMGHFYRNLLTNNAAMGTKKEAEQKPAQEEGRSKDAEDAEAGPSSEAVAAKSKQEAELDRYERMRLEAERALRERKAAAAAAGAPHGGGEGSNEDRGGGGDGRAAAPAAQGSAGGVEAEGEAGRAAGDGVAAGTPGGEPPAEQPPAAAAAAGKRRNDDSAVAELRARYLARRQKR